MDLKVPQLIIPSRHCSALCELQGSCSHKRGHAELAKAGALFVESRGGDPYQPRRSGIVQFGMHVLLCVLYAVYARDIRI